MTSPDFEAQRPPLRLAMWSGPRNISTAMMRAWENRPDTSVWDEPLYAHYLAATGSPHPMRDEVIAAGPREWRDVAARVTGPVPNGKPIFYQKHMTHHLLPEIDRAWLTKLTHVFLIRDPREVLLSYGRARTVDVIKLEDIGFPQQAEIFQWVCDQSGETPLVIDSGDFLRQPAWFLETLCTRLGIEFTDKMLHWPAGPRGSDGVWAPHWYASVWKSTGFEPWRERTQLLPDDLKRIEEAARPLYCVLAAHRLRPDG